MFAGLDLTYLIFLIILSFLLRVLNNFTQQKNHVFLVQNFMLYLNHFKYFIYHERIQRYKPNIDLTHEKMPKIKISLLRDIGRTLKFFGEALRWRENDAAVTFKAIKATIWLVIGLFKDLFEAQNLHLLLVNLNDLELV